MEFKRKELLDEVIAIVSRTELDRVLADMCQINNSKDYRKESDSVV